MESITVASDGAPVRLDVFLARHIPQCSRRTAQRAVAEGIIRVNGRRARKGHMLRGGDVVQVADDLLAPAALQPNSELAIPVLYEDAAVIALDKPAGMPSHALRGREQLTVANFLLARYPELEGVGKTPLEPGIVHRLDTETSGILLVARTAAAYDALRRQFATHRVTKEYLALVHGDVVAAGEVRAPIAHDPRSHRRMRVCAGSGSRAARPAVTFYSPLEHLTGATLLSVRIPTGVMHQIRVHLASIGHPIVGDRLYGRGVAGISAPRHMLHAHQLTFAHPLTGASTRISCDAPRDFSACRDALRPRIRARLGRARNRPGAETPRG